MGPLLELKDPEFLRWSNMRIVVSIGLGSAVLNGLWDAAVHGWGGISVFKVVFIALWFPVVFVGLHLFFRPKRKRPDDVG
jgi:hypothetical protein